MKRIVVAVMVALLAACAVTPPKAPVAIAAVSSPADPYAADYAQTAGIVIFAVNDEPAIVEFITVAGKHAAFEIAQCAHDAECSALVKRAEADGKLDVIGVTDGLTT